ncbi:undecaprenyl-diphosphatase [Peribacillus acanthi]|uniref:undecaprenyl-diphosphatase n=1 Tax=Peribacillus acanthi TaxID=2171554 RepID=UPI000D3E3EE0|nr:undecaprenyl-diphosphatase [Peribacillus acanthi]
MEEINIQYFRAINDLGKEFDIFNPLFLVTAEYTVYLLALALLVFWISGQQHNRMMVMSAGASFIVAEIFGKIAGLFHSNFQPFAELADVNQLVEKGVNNSFPSDHTILFFSICFSILFFRKKLGSLFVMLALCVGLSRIGVGVHYPADVFVGAVIGIISAYIAFRVVPQLGIFKWLLNTYEKGERFLVSGKSKDIS